MNPGELWYHYANVIVLAALIAPLILWRYRVAVLTGMQSSAGASLTPPSPSADASTSPADRVPAPPTQRILAGNPSVWETSARKRVFVAVIAATLPSSLLLGALVIHIDQLPITPAHLLLQTTADVSTAIPIYAVLMAIPFWRALRLWLGFLVACAIGIVVLSMLQRAFAGRAPGFDQLYNFVLLFQYVAVMAGPLLIVLLVTGRRKVRGVAPLVFAGLLAFGLAPLLGSRLTTWLSGTREGVQVLFSTGLDIGFIVFALPTGWLAWLRLKALAHAYEAKRTSDGLLLARAWWLVIVADLVLMLVNASDQWLLIGCAGTAAYLMFPPLLERCLLQAIPPASRPPPRQLLLLRVFGYTGRTEALFDRIGARWRLFGPVTMIAAPDVVARTVDPGDFLRFMIGHIDTSFVNSRADLDTRLAGIDAAPDPDGRYRINDFCCRDNTWQATVVELITRADAVIMDLRGYSQARQGCSFELEQLRTRLAHSRLVLVTDKTTDLALLEQSLTPVMARAVALRRVEHGSVAETDTVFGALLEAAYAPPRAC